MIRPFCLPVALAIALSMTTPAWAQLPLGLHAAVEEALSHNPQVRAVNRQLEAAQARETQAGVLPNPNVTFAIDEVPVPQPIQGIYTVGVSQPLLVGGLREARIGVAKLDATLAGFDRDVMRLELTEQTTEAYVQLLFEREGLRLARLNDAAAASFLKTAQARLRAGEAAEVEVLRADVERSRAQREVASAANRELKARGELNVLLGREAQLPLAIAPLAATAAPKLPPLPDMVRLAIANRIELKQAELAIEREVLQRRVAQTSLWTGTEANVSAGLIGGMPGFSTSLTLPVPLYRQQGEIAEAEANRGRAEAERDVRRNAITLDVEQAYREAVSAAQLAELFRKTYVPQAERLLDNAERRYQAGEGTGLEAVDARRALQEARTEHQRALLEYRRALAHLERASGTSLF